MINRDYDAPRYKTSMKGVKFTTFLRLGAFWLICFIMSLISIDMYAFMGRTIILFAIIACAGITILSYLLVPTERPQQLISAKRDLFLYNVALIGAHIVILRLNSIDPNMAGVSLGMSTGQVTNNATLGWLQLMIQFIIVGGPISHFFLEVKRIWFAYGFGFGRMTKRKRSETLRKTITR